MTITELKSRVYFLAGIGSSSDFTDAEFLLCLNQQSKRLRSLIFSKQSGWDSSDSNNTGFPILYTDLVDGQQDYGLEATTLAVKRVQVSYDGVSHYQAKLKDIGEMQGALTEDDITNSFSKDNPFYDIQYGAIFLYPIPDADVTSGLTLWIDEDAYTFTSGDITAGTKYTGFNGLADDLLAKYITYDFKLAKNLEASRLKNEIVETELRFEKILSQSLKDEKLSITSNWGDYN
jgi:hypothetical protein